MIIKVTTSSTDSYIDTDIVLYAYDNTGMEFILNLEKAKISPCAELFENNAPNAVSYPTYADFVTANVTDFIELPHATLTNVCLNLKRVLRLEAIDSSNTLVLFDNNASVPVSMSLATLQAALNAALAPSSSSSTFVSEDIVSDGSGVLTLSNRYISGTCNVFVRGVLVKKSKVSETGLMELTLTAGVTSSGDFINVNYLY